MKSYVFFVVGAWLIICGSVVLAGDIADRYRSIASHGLQAPTTLPTGDKGQSITEIGIERADTFNLHGGDSIVLKRDGSFRYEGETDNGQPERYTGQVGANEFERLAAYVAASGFMGMDRSYRSHSTDRDTLYAMVVTDGGAKIVKDYGEAAPVNLWAVENIIRGMLPHHRGSDTGSDRPATTRPTGRNGDAMR